MCIKMPELQKSHFFDVQPDFYKIPNTAESA